MNVDVLKALYDLEKKIEEGNKKLEAKLKLYIDEQSKKKVTKTKKDGD